jgi:hypothetical protein
LRELVAPPAEGSGEGWLSLLGILVLTLARRLVDRRRRLGARP